MAVLLFLLQPRLVSSIPVLGRRGLLTTDLPWHAELVHKNSEPGRPKGLLKWEPDLATASQLVEHMLSLRRVLGCKKDREPLRPSVILRKNIGTREFEVSNLEGYVHDTIMPSGLDVGRRRRIAERQHS